MKKWIKDRWSGLLQISYPLYGIFLFVILTVAGLWGLFPISLGGLIFNCTMIIVMGIFFIREALVAILTATAIKDKNVKHIERKEDTTTVR